MNRIRSAAPRSLLLLLLGVVLTPGCGDYRSPTAPVIVPTPTPVPVAPEPPAGSIAGAWIGTRTDVYDEDEGSCVEPTTARFAQSGSAVSGTLTDSSECGASNQDSFEGTLEGNLLIGTIDFPAFGWPTRGLLSGDHLTVSARNVVWDLHR